MIAERVEHFILELISKTQDGMIRWKAIDTIDTWEKIKRQIEKEIDLKGYFINESKSYGINKCGGYVMLLNLQYSNAPVFSPALDKYSLFIKINDAFFPQNIFDNDHQGDKELLIALIEAIEMKEYEEYIMPDCMYDFFKRILGEDENGRTINE